MGISHSGCRDLLKLYTRVEHICYVMGSDPDFSGSQAGTDLVSCIDGVTQSFGTKDSRLLALWSRLATRFKTVGLSRAPIPKDLLHCAYLLASYTWYELALTEHPTGKLEAQAQRVTVHPPEMIAKLVGMTDATGMRTADVIDARLSKAL